MGAIETLTKAFNTLILRDSCVFKIQRLGIAPIQALLPSANPKNAQSDTVIVPAGHLANKNHRLQLDPLSLSRPCKWSPETALQYLGLWIELS
jgi:hypothetical protein